MANGQTATFTHAKLSGFAAFKKLERQLEEQEKIPFITERFRGRKRRHTVK